MVEAKGMNEQGYNYHRDNPCRSECPLGGSRFVNQEPAEGTRYLGEEYTFHVRNRVNSYCGPGPDCDNQNYDQEPPNGPSEIGLYDSLIVLVPPQELNSITRLINEGGNVAPQVKDITPSRGMVNPTPSTEELVRRLGDGWDDLKQGLAVPRTCAYR